MRNYTEFLTAIREKDPRWRKIEGLIEIPIADALKIALTYGDLCRSQARDHWDAYRLFRAQRGEESPNMEHLEARCQSGDASLVDKALYLFGKNRSPDIRTDNA